LNGKEGKFGESNKNMKYTVIIALIALLYFGCGDDEKVKASKTGDGVSQEEVAYDTEKDLSIQELNLRERRKFATRRFPGDTLDLMEYVIKSYPKGTYLVDCDRTFTFNIPQSAVIYRNQGEGAYIVGLIAKSKEDDERLIEQKNLIGFDASFIDLDSTELGTAFFYLTLFKYSGGAFSTIWEAPVPTHGGFNNITWQTWKANNTPYIRVYFHYAQGSGHIDYNYFLVDGLTNPPHLLMTYEGINIKRTMAEINHDKIPDYYEFVYIDTGERVYQPDSVAFVWKDTAYFNVNNRRQWRKY
jgi:hypothetical protein